MSAPLLQALLTSYIRQIQYIEDATWQVAEDRWLTTAEGQQLDNLGDILQQPRTSSDDELYRSRLRARILINKACGTAEELIHLARMLVDEDATFELVEYFPNFVHMGLTIEADDIGVEPAELLSILSLARAATVTLELYYYLTNAFQFSDTGSIMVDTDLGFGNTAQTQGGKLAEILRG